MLNRLRTFLFLPLIALIVPVMLVACGGDDDAEGDNGDGGSGDAITAFADAAEAEFDERGEGTFIDTGFAAYCRQGGGFDGPFEAMGFEPDDSAEYCYNISSDLTMVALGVTQGTDSPTECMVLDGSSGSVVRGAVSEMESCSP